MLRYLDLKPTLWSQSVKTFLNNDSDKATEGTALSLNARSLPDTELSLKDGKKLKDYEISLSIIPGEIAPEELQKRRLSPDAFGGLWYIEEDDFVHGWFFFKPHNYGAIWDQVRTGGYQDCTITLGVMLEHDAWTENPLSIVSADIRFDRLPLISKPGDQQRTSRKNWFG